MKLVIDKRAQRRLGEMPAKARIAMVERLKAIAEDPFADHPNVKPLRGEPSAFRLRQGDWRIPGRSRCAGSEGLRDREPPAGAYR